jgi:hypothetical protein
MSAQEVCDRTYFSATDGNITVFRTSERQIYPSATFRVMIEQSQGNGRPHPTGRTIFNTHAARGDHCYLAQENTKQHYEELVRMKEERLEEDGRNLGSHRTSQDSWIRNEQLGLFAPAPAPARGRPALNQRKDASASAFRRPPI